MRPIDGGRTVYDIMTKQVSPESKLDFGGKTLKLIFHFIGHR
jgi:hypothetical protein